MSTATVTLPLNLLATQRIQSRKGNPYRQAMKARIRKAYHKGLAANAEKFNGRNG
jgi:hypothetical protein